MALVEGGQEYETAELVVEDGDPRRSMDEEEDLLNEIILSGRPDGAKSISPARLPLRFAPVTKQSIPELRSLNATLFPMAYQDRYYREVLASDSLARIVFWNDRVVSTFSCRIQAFYEGEVARLECYIMTFGVLAPFRRLHIGSLMLQTIITYYRRKPEIRRITLHVHTANPAALNFYTRHGFEHLQLVSNYYKRLQPSSAFLLGLDL